MIFGNPVRGTIYKSTTVAGRWEVSQRFGCTGFRHEPPLGSCAHFHRGIDLINSSAREIIAPAAGTVRVSQREPNGEQLIALHHGAGIVTFYGHLRSRAVAKGAKVAKGQKIGEMGTTGNSTGVHLHFALKTGVNTVVNVYPDSNGDWKDPWPQLEQNVTIHLDPDDGVNVRTTRGSGTTKGPLFATTRGGRIIRTDGKDLGPSSAERKWRGTVTGASYPAGPGYPAGNRWDAFDLDGGVRYAADALAVRSAS